MSAFIVERCISRARQLELGVDAWPLWKESTGSRTLDLDATEKSYFLTGEAVLTLAAGESVHVGAGDLVTLPSGACLWDVRADVRRRYRSDALSPACCII